MRNKIIIVFLMSTLFGYSQDVWMIGPMLHVNFGGGKPNVSYGVETSYWNISHFFYGVDGGIEYGGKRFRLYSELQTGFGLAGVSVGPLVEYNVDEASAHLGMQYTIWANYFLGLDYRHRWVDDTKFNSVGAYLKLPTSIFNSNNSTSSSSNSSSSHHHWDWD